MHPISFSLSYLLFGFCPVKRQEKTNSLVRKHKIIRFMFRINLLRKNTVGESGAPSLFQKEKRRSVKFDVSKVLFPGIGKIITVLLCGQYRAVNERSYWLTEMNVRKTLQASAFSFIVLNAAEKAVLHFFLIMLSYIMSALRKNQQQLPTQSTLKKNH